VISVTAAQQQIGQSPATPYRIGIVAYDDIQERARTMKRYFSELHHEVTFASGTAEEVLDWVNEGAVDIAVLSPGAFTATGPWTDEDPDFRTTWNCRYLITHALPISQSPFASPERKVRTDLFRYQPLCLMNKASLEELGIDPSNPVEKLKEAAAAGKLQFVFADPLSLSGTIVPRAQLNEMKIAWKEQAEFSFGVSDTLEMLLDEPEITVAGKKRCRVGFVFDGTIPRVWSPESENGKDANEAAANAKVWLLEQMGKNLQVVKLPLPIEPPRLESDGLPTEVWVVRPDFKLQNIKKLRKQLCDVHFPDSDRSLFQDQSNPATLNCIADRVRMWADLGGIDLRKTRKRDGSSISEILDSMRHFQRRYHKSPRLALVLSGGGAKCAYQAGAIGSIERQLLARRDFTVLAPTGPDGGNPRMLAPEINLVVGTSGGALNALPTAMRITADPTTKDALANVWKKIHLTRLLQPYFIVRLLLGLFLGLTLLFVTWLISMPFARLAGANQPSVSQESKKTVSSPSLSARAPLILYIFLMVVLLIFWGVNFFWPDRVLFMAPKSRVWYYFFWLPLNLGAGWAVIVLGAGATVHAIRSGTAAGFERLFWRRLAVVVASSVLLTLVVLCVNKSLSDGATMRELVVTHFGKLLKKGKQSGSSRTDGELELQSTRLSAAICDPDRQRTRDLVMTVSVLGKRGSSDRYLYLPANADSPVPNYDQRGIHLCGGCESNYAEDRTQLINLMMASGTIFPIFPSHWLRDPASESDTPFIDGGFAHNIPVEAAVDWGATHIIVIEASPPIDTSEQGSLLGNLGIAFDHLFAQAQLTDVRSRESVEIYTLQPKEEVLKTLDFVPALTKKAVQQGEKDASAADGGFRQFSRVPKFKPVAAK
jgi:predicted acylesterase/phospholipase RssA